MESETADMVGRGQGLRQPVDSWCYFDPLVSKQDENEIQENFIISPVKVISWLYLDIPHQNKRISHAASV